MRRPSINDGVWSQLLHPFCSRTSSPRSRTLTQFFRISAKRSLDRDQSQIAGTRRVPSGPGFVVAPCAAAHRAGSTISPYRKHWGRVVLMPCAPLPVWTIFPFCKNFPARCSTTSFCRASMTWAFQRHAAFSVIRLAEAASRMGKKRSKLHNRLLYRRQPETPHKFETIFNLQMPVGHYLLGQIKQRYWTDDSRGGSPAPPIRVRSSFETNRNHPSF